MSIEYASQVTLTIVAVYDIPHQIHMRPYARRVISLGISILSGEGVMTNLQWVIKNKLA